MMNKIVSKKRLIKAALKATLKREMGNEDSAEAKYPHIYPSKDLNIVSSFEMLRIWDQAEPRAERVKRFIVNCGVAADQVFDHPNHFVDELLENIRYEKNVIFVDWLGIKKTIPCMLVKVSFSDRDLDKCYQIMFIPLDENNDDICNNHGRRIPLEGYKITSEELERKTSCYGFVMLSNITENMAFCRFNIKISIQIMIKYNVPVCFYVANVALLNASIDTFKVQYLFQPRISFIEDEEYLTEKFKSKFDSSDHNLEFIYLEPSIKTLDCSHGEKHEDSNDNNETAEAIINNDSKLSTDCSGGIDETQPDPRPNRLGPLKPLLKNKKEKCLILQRVAPQKKMLIDWDMQ